MTIEQTNFQGLHVLTPDLFEDERGFFYESYNQKALEEAGIHLTFVQDNHSFSKNRVIRGLHFQRPPHGQTKLVRVLHGEILDVVVDIRRTSDTFRQFFSIKLSGSNRLQLLVPKGFAHGFVVLSDVAVVNYKCDDFYFPELECGIRFDDPQLNISWGYDNQELIVSNKDKMLENLADTNIEF